MTTPPAPGAAPTDGPADRPTMRLTRRSLCILLLLASTVFAANMWVELTRDTFDWHDPGKVPNMDFAQYYAGGTNWGLGLDPYRNHPGVSGSIEHPRMNQPALTGYIYPPTLLPVFGQLARLPYDSARTVWLALDLAAFAALVAVASLVHRGRRLETLTSTVLLTVVSFPFYWHITYGQIDMIVAALSISAFLLYPRWRGWPSAALFALAVATKVTPVVILAVLVAYHRDWRFLLKTLACAAVTLAVALLAVEGSLFVEYVVRVLPAISMSDPSAYNQTPLRFWSNYPPITKLISLLGYAILVLLAWVAGRATKRLPTEQRRVDQRTERYALLLFSVLMMLFFSPLAWQQAYVWPIVPMALVIVSPPPRGRSAAVVLLGVAALLLSAPVVGIRALDMPNVIGAGLAILTLLLFYLPLERGETGG